MIMNVSAYELFHKVTNVIKFLLCFLLSEACPLFLRRVGDTWVPDTGGDDLQVFIGTFKIKQ